MDYLKNVYDLVRSPSNEMQKQAYQAINEVYSDISNISALFGLLRSSDFYYQRQAAIGIRHILKLHWNSVSGSSVGEDIKKCLLELLIGECNLHIRHLIIDSFEAVLNDSSFLWPELIECLDIFINSDDEESIEVAFSILIVFSSKIGSDHLLQVIAPFYSRIIMSFQTNNPDLMTSASELVSKLYSLFESSVPTELEDCYADLITIYREALFNELPFSMHLANSLCGIIPYMNSNQAGNLFDFLIDNSLNEELPLSSIICIFIPLSSLFESHYSLIKQRLSIVCNSIIKCSSRCFIDDCAEEQSDIYFITNLYYTLVNHSNTTALFEETEKDLGGSSECLSFVSLCILCVFIDESPSTVADNLNLFISFILGQINNDNHHSVLEQAYICLHHITRVINGGLIEFSSQIIDSLIPALSCDHLPILQNCLNALNEVMTTIEIDYHYFPEIFNSLVNVFSTGVLVSSVLSSLNSFIFASQFYLDDFFARLYEIYSIVFQNEDDIHTNTKSLALTGVVLLYRHAPNHMQQYTQVIISLITTFLESEDLSFISCALNSLSMIVDLPGRHFSEIQFQSLFTVSKVLELDFSIEESSDESEEQRLLVEAKCASMDILKSLSERKLDYIKSNIELYIGLLDRHLFLPEEQIQSSAIRTLGQITLSFNLDANETIQMLEEVFSLDSSQVVGELFKMASKIIRSGTDISISNIQFLVHESILALQGKQQCQSGEIDDSQTSYNFELMRPVYSFLCSVASMPGSVSSSFFPSDSFISIVRQFSKNKRIIDVSYSTMVISSLYSKNYDDLTAIAKKAMLQIVFSSIKDCDGSFEPVSILSAINVIETDFESCKRYIDPLIENISEILSIENEGQPALEQTKGSAAALIFVLMINLRDGFDTDTFMPIALEQFPLKTKKESQIAYSYLNRVIAELPSIISQYHEMIMIALAKVLSLSDQEFKRMKMPDEIINELVKHFKFLRSREPHLGFDNELMCMNGYSILMNRIK